MPLRLEDLDPIAHRRLEGDVLLSGDPPGARFPRLELQQGVLVVARQEGDLRRGLASVRTGQGDRHG